MLVPVLAGAALIYVFSEFLARSCVGFLLEARFVAAQRRCAGRGRCERGPEGAPRVRPGAKPAPPHPKYSGHKVLRRRENTWEL